MFFGRDPAASLEQEDDVLAHNLRLGLALGLARNEAEEPTESERHATLIDRARRGAAALRKRLDG